MLTYLRYALATICFALSVACLGLWGWSPASTDLVHFVDWSTDGTDYYADGVSLHVQLGDGEGMISLIRRLPYTNVGSIEHLQAGVLRGESVAQFTTMRKQPGSFAVGQGSIFFSLWYPALVFALAGIGALRLGRRFTIRSAIIATTVVAGLLGMVVVM
jgi:hypothetical protein